MLSDFKVRFAGQVFDCLDSGFASNENVDVVVRPEDVDIVRKKKNLCAASFHRHIQGRSL